MESFNKLTNRILLWSGAFLISVICIFCFLLHFSNETKQFACANKPIESFCGTKNLSSKAQEGKKLFNNNCAACHKMDANITGPALRNTDSIIFYNWLHLQNSKINISKLNQLGIDYHRNFSKKHFEDSDLKKSICI